MCSHRSFALAGLVVSIATGCTGTITGGGGGAPGPDAGAVTTGGGGGSASGSGSNANNCSPVVMSGLVSGQHNAGQNCLGCHNGATAPSFTLAGTLYTSNGSPQVGGTIMIVDAANTTTWLVTAQNGNFYTSNAITFPVSVTASACPTTMRMSSNVGAGGCAAAGCHVSGGQGPIHL